MFMYGAAWNRGAIDVGQRWMSRIVSGKNNYQAFVTVIGIREKGDKNDGKQIRDMDKIN